MVCALFYENQRIYATQENLWWFCCRPEARIHIAIYKSNVICIWRESNIWRSGALSRRRLVVQALRRRR